MGSTNQAFRAFRQSHWYKRLLWVGVVYLAYALLGFFVPPPIIKSQRLKRLPAATKRRVAIRQVKFSPLVLSLTIRGLSLNEPDGSVFASWEELYVNFQLSSLLRFTWTFDEIGLKQPYGHLIPAKDGRFNFANLSDESAPPPPKTEKPWRFPRVNVWRLHIDDGMVVWDDDTHCNLGTALAEKGQTDEAISQFQEAVRLKPDYALPHNNLGNALQRKGRTGEAVRQFQEALRLKPNYAEARKNLDAALATRANSPQPPGASTSS